MKTEFDRWIIMRVICIQSSIGEHSKVAKKNNLEMFEPLIPADGF
jgi:hypothetical protein